MSNDERAQREATAEWTADQVEEALRHPDPRVRQAMLVYALRDLGEGDLRALASAANEHLEGHRRAQRAASATQRRPKKKAPTPAVVQAVKGQARLIGHCSNGNVYQVDPFYPTEPGAATCALLVATREGQTVVSACREDGWLPADARVLERFVTVVTDEHALGSLGYEVTLPTDQSPEPAEPSGIPGVPQFIAERERREATFASLASQASVSNVAKACQVVGSAANFEEDEK